MVRILVRRNRARVPLARPSEPDIPSKRTEKVQLSIYQTHIQPRDHDIAGHVHGIYDFRLANYEFGNENGQFYNTELGKYQNLVYTFGRSPLLLGEKPLFALSLHRCRLWVDFP